MANERGETALEKRELEVRFIPIGCATPLVYAKVAGFFERNGLSVTLRPAAGWSGIKELLVHRHIDAAHILSPMTLASSLGLDGKPEPLRLCAMQNVNGQAFVLARKHIGLRDIREMKGFRFGVPYPFSMQYYLLCALLSRNGLDPIHDVVIEEVAPPRMPHYIRHGRLDAIVTPEPFGEVLVSQGEGVLFASSQDLWPGHPCCGLAVTAAFAEANPRTCEMLARSLMEAQFALRNKRGAARADIADEIAAVAGWNQPTVAAMRRVLAGTHLDASETMHGSASRIDFIPHPFHAYGIWMLAQMQRLGQCGNNVNAEATVRAIFMEDEAIRIATEVGHPEMRPSFGGVALDSTMGTATSAHNVCADGLLPEGVREFRHDLPESTQKRMDVILRWLAALVGGESVAPLDVTSTDCIGWLERMLNEAALNARFTVEALAERMEAIEEARQREALVEAQRSLIHELSAPIIPILDRVLALPLVGPFDDIRAARVTEVLLERIAGSDVDVVLIDVTGVRAIDANGIEQWLRMTRAASLLGAECVIVGITAAVAKEILVHAPDAALPRTFADLKSGIAYALTRTGRRIRRIADH